MTESDKARAWRLALGITQKELAAQIGLHVKTVANMERGHYPSGEPIKRATWRHYRLACAGFDYMPSFDWKPAKWRQSVN